MSSIRIRQGKQGTTFNALWRDEDGVQHSKSFATRSEAKAFLKPGSVVARTKTHVSRAEGNVAAFADTWVESHPLKPVARQTYQNVLRKHVIPAIGKTRLAKVTRAEIYTVVKRWQAEGMSPSLQAKCRAVMTSMFEDAVQRGLISENPARGVKVSRQITREMRVLTVDEYRRVLPHIPEEYRLLVRLAVASGCRWGELAELRGGDLVNDTLIISRNVAELKSPHRFVVQRTTKNGKTRKVKIPSALAAELHNQPGLLFSRNGGYISREQFGRMWARAQRAAGITSPCRAHDLRHTAISWWLADGMPLATVRDRAGHWNISITSRYIHAVTDAEDDALGRSAA